MDKFKQISTEEWKKRVHGQRSRSLALDEQYLVERGYLKKRLEEGEYLIADEVYYPRLLEIVKEEADRAGILPPGGILISNRNYGGAAVDVSEEKKPLNEREYLLFFSEWDTQKPEEDLRAVIRHELGHVRQNSIRKVRDKLPSHDNLARKVGDEGNLQDIIIASGVAASLLSYVQESRAAIGVWLAGITTIYAAGLAKTAIKWYQELDADKFSASLGGASSVSSALSGLVERDEELYRTAYSEKKLKEKQDGSKNDEQKPSSRIVGAVASRAKYVSKTLKGNNTHPPVSWRIRMLDRMAAKEAKDTGQNGPDLV